VDIASKVSLDPIARIPPRTGKSKTKIKNKCSSLHNVVIQGLD